MTDRVINKAWSDVSPRDFVRWATPRFVKYGVILSRKGESMTLNLLDEDRPRVVPTARWYYAQGKIHGADTEEHLVVIEALPEPMTSYMIPPTPEATGELISVNEACELIKMDPKQFRRYIRRGVIPATKHNDRWVIDASTLRSIAAKHGWV